MCADYLSENFPGSKSQNQHEYYLDRTMGIPTLKMWKQRQKFKKRVWGQKAVAIPVLHLLRDISSRSPLLPMSVSGTFPGIILIQQYNVPSFHPE